MSKPKYLGGVWILIVPFIALYHIAAVIGLSLIWPFVAYRRTRLTSKRFRNRTIALSDVLAKAHGTVVFARRVGGKWAWWWYEGDLENDFNIQQIRDGNPLNDEFNVALGIYFDRQFISVGPTFVWLLDVGDRSYSEVVKAVTDPPIAKTLRFINLDQLA